ncbi:cytochrome-c oxidase chain VIIc-like protein [Coniella lustricola]|uniref:Cytochrome c oxidase subunit 8, mitochondrial n=1 Tax=Coniella lustricola TaxID=2025994 RepID=A0A2T3AGP0_9PEZI|nr:cytochrome-c oxidase chain VIIc-like protein [Coniella lustricola]
MFSRAAVRATTQVAGRRAFHATRPRMSSPYHYPEGPYTNIPFDPKKKGFPILFWGYAIVGFGAPFAIATWQTYKPKA